VHAIGGQCPNGQALPGSSACAYERQSGPAPNARKTRRLAPLGLVPHDGACNRVNTGTQVVLSPSLSDAAGRTSRTCSSMQAQQQHARTHQQLVQGAKHTGRHSYSIAARSGYSKPAGAAAAHVDPAAAGVEREARWQAQQANRHNSMRVCGRPDAHPNASMALLIFSTNRARLTFIISCPEVRKCNVKKLFHNFVKLMRSHGS
jgi:hypothetical protein